MMGLLDRLFVGVGVKAKGERGLHPSAHEGWESIFGGAGSVAGLAAPSVEGSLALPAVYACVQVLAQTIASLPLILYRERADGGRERATQHGLYRILKMQPNPEQSSYEFRELQMAHAAMWGNAFAEIEWSRGGQVRGLWPLRPDAMRVGRVQGMLRYVYRLPNGDEVELPAWRVLHVRGMGGDGVLGYSPVRMAMTAIALGLATEEFGARFFSNGARPGMVIRHPGQLSETAYERIKKSWRGENEGLSNAHRIRILEEGMEATAIGVPPDEAQFLETRRFQAEDVARIYRVPPHKIGLLEHATFSNIEHQALEFVGDTIRPWLVRLEQGMARQLLSEEEQASLYVEHLVDALLRGDTLSRYQAHAVGRQWGWLSVNDVRRMENMDAIEGGDEYLQPLNMMRIGEAQEGVGE